MAGKSRAPARVHLKNNLPTSPLSSYLDSTTNGLTYVADRLRGVSMYGHVLLKTTVRSTLAAVAAELL